ncbi:MAG TPA: hypothetical protein EYP85_12760, partial [Armatimonadetes bacterium]|nr:hypothetical protein [Armatimonadota bacterium]
MVRSFCQRGWSSKVGGMLVVCLLEVGAVEGAEISAGDWTARFSPYNGLTLTYRGLTVIERAPLMVRNDGQVVFSWARQRPTVKVTSLPSAQILAVSYPAESEAKAPFSCNYRVTLWADNRVFINLEYASHSSRSLRVDYRLGHFLDTLFAGRKYTVTTNRGQYSGQFPLLPPSSGVGTRTVAEDLRDLTLHAPLGDLRLSVVEGSDPLSLFDSRQQYWVAFSRTAAVWLGIQRWLRPGGRGRCGVLLTFTPRPVTDTAPLEVVTHPSSLAQERVMAAWLPARGARWLLEPTTATESDLTVVDAQQGLLPTPVAPAVERRVQHALTWLERLFGERLELQPAPPQARPVLIPRPHVLRWQESDFVFDRTTRLALATDAEEGLLRVAEGLQRHLEQVFERKVPLVHLARADDTPGLILLSTLNDALERSIPSPQPLAARVSRRPEGYWLKVTPRRVRVVGGSVRGVFYGVQTLQQLLKIGELGELAATGVFIEDWPTFAFRGIHLLADDHALEWHKQLIRDVFAPLKINTIVLECEYARWDTQPDLAPEWAMTKGEMRELCAYAREHFIEVIPLVQTLGHCGWLFRGGRNLDLAEDPEEPYAYCVTNPRTYEVIFGILREVLEVFQPRYVHLGHDEVTHRGRFPYRSAGWRARDLFVEDVRKLHDFLSRRGVRMMLWGDMLLRPGEANDAAHGGAPDHLARARRRLPRDIVICDWHYGVFPDYPSLRVFQRDGFPVVAASWMNPRNIYQLSRAAWRARSWGLLQTTWTGYGGNREAPRQHYDQLAAYVLAAEYAWSPHIPPLEHLGYVPGEVLSRLAAQHRPVGRQPRDGYLVDLLPYCTVALRDDVSSGWVGYGPAYDLRRLPTGTQRLGEVVFKIGRLP